MKEYLLPLSFLLLLLVACAPLTDGAYPYYDQECTMYPEGPWTEPCCLPHDEAYRAGGSEASRLAHDEVFRACMTEYVGEEDAQTLFEIVRKYGSLWWGKE